MTLGDFLTCAGIQYADLLLPIEPSIQIRPLIRLLHSGYYFGREGGAKMKIDL